MVSIVFALRRLPAITIEQFASYWSTEHASLFARYAEVLGVRRYVQLHRAPGPLADALRASRGAAPGYDGLAQVWFDSMADLAAGLTSAAGRAAGEALIADETRFIDLGSSSIWIADEREIDLSQSGVAQPGAGNEPPGTATSNS